MKLNPTLKRIGASALAAAVLTAVAALGLLNRPDATVSDALYQIPYPTDGQIVVIGMD